MLVTGTTLIALFKALSKPVETVKTQVEEAYQEAQEKEAKEGKQLKIIKGFDPNISVDDIPQKRKSKTEDLDHKQAKVVSTYYDEPMPQEILSKPEGTEDKAKLDRALDLAEKEEIDFKAETKEFTENLENAEKVENTYVFPPLTLLKKSLNPEAATQGAQLTAEHLINTLKSFGVEARVVNISRGPTVTRYELQPSAGVKISKITNLADDIALNLAAAGVRIEAPIPNKAAVGI